jgi:hypothetical protein
MDEEAARAAVREFLTTRRARVTPTDAGLPPQGTRRRVKGLRREEVALLAGVSPEYYVRLERGKPPGRRPESSTPSPTSCASTPTNAPTSTGYSPLSPPRPAKGTGSR